MLSFTGAHHQPRQWLDGFLDSALMLILDVRTCWSSTHQMLRRAVDFRDVVDSFVSRNKELHAYEMSTSDWDAISMVTSWLKSFRSATTQMSASKKPMLSTTHAVFRGLQNDIKSILTGLPDSMPSEIKKGLADAHLKLSDYYYKFDESPFYIWSSLLDPRISYTILKEDYANDSALDAYLELAKQDLHEYYMAHYAPTPNQPTQSLTTSTASIIGRGGPGQHSPQKSFTARYKKATSTATNELEQYYQYPQEDFDHCNPLQWWYKRHQDMPNLYRLARDLMTIPGSAVAVERIFSSGRDSVSLRRARLLPDTICTLMLVKHCLCKAREAIEVVLDEDD